MPQSLASILVHLVFSTKNRAPFLRESIEGELYKYLATVLAESGSPALAINGTADHVHILLRLSRTWTIADIVEEAKKRSSKWLKTKGAMFRGFQWQTGYGAFSIGQSQVAALKGYIRKQKVHHKGKSFQEEYRKLLSKYEVEFAERYVWD